MNCDVELTTWHVDFETA